MKGREIRDFVNAFGIGASIGDRWAQRANDRERIEMERERTEGWKSNPEVQGIDAELRRRRSATGSLPQMPRQATRSPTPLVSGAMEPMSIRPSSFGGGLQPTYAGGGLVDAIFPTQRGEAQRIADLEAIQASKRLRRATEGIPSDVTETGGTPLVEPASFREPYTPPGLNTTSLPEYEQPGRNNEYARRGSLPNYERPGGITSDMKPLSGTAAVTQPGNTPSAGGAGSSATAATATPGSTAPATGGGSTGGSAGGPARRKNLNDQTRVEAFDPDNEQDWAQADERVKAAIKGGMQFAAQQFHLANPNDPNHQEGKMMFFRGTGAPDPQTIRALDQTLQQNSTDPVSGDDPFGTAKLQLRRMTIAYEWYASRGDFDRANKMAFELMQFSRMAVGQLAGSAAGMVQQDPQRAVGMIAQALDAIPDGYKVVAGPNGTIQYYAANGRPLQTVQMTPQKLLATANGLADGTLYWQILNERANMVPGVAKDATAASKAAVDAKRIELMDARIKKLGQPSGRAGPPPLDRYDDMLGRLSTQGAVSPDYQGRAREPAQGSNDGGGEAPDSKEPDPAVEELRSQLREQIEENVENALIGEGGGEGGTLGTTNNPAAEPGGVTKPAPASPLRLKPARPDQGVYTPKPAADAAPAAPSERAARPVDGTTVPDQVVGAKPKAQAPQFNKPHPMAEYGMKDPYAQMLAGVDPTTGKPDPVLREKVQNNRKFRADVVRLQGILRQQVSDYNRERKEFEEKAAKAAKANEPGRAEPAIKPSTVEATDKMADSIRTSIDEFVKDKKPSPFNDGFSKPEDLGEIAMEIATSNHNMPTKRAVQIVGDLMRAGTEPDERTLRAFKLLGRDESRQYVFLSPLSDPTRKIKMHKDAYDRMNALIEQRWTMRQKQGSTKGGSWGAVGDVVFPPNTRRKPSSPFLLN